MDNQDVKFKIDTCIRTMETNLFNKGPKPLGEVQRLLFIILVSEVDNVLRQSQIQNVMLEE
jgi:hypothetical protein